jgi:hypothetical protein
MDCMSTHIHITSSEPVEIADAARPLPDLSEFRPARSTASPIITAPDCVHFKFVGLYVIVRTYSAGAWAGVLVSRDGKEVELTEARRLWRWEGAASLSQMALTGPTKSAGCKFPAPVNVILTEAIEIMPATDTARAAIEAVKVWSE